MRHFNSWLKTALMAVTLPFCIWSATQLGRYCYLPKKSTSATNLGEKEKVSKDTPEIGQMGTSNERGPARNQEENSRLERVEPNNRILHSDPAISRAINDWESIKTQILEKKLLICTKGVQVESLKIIYQEKKSFRASDSELTALSLKIQEEEVFRETEFGEMTRLFGKIGRLKRENPILAEIHEKQILEMGDQASRYLLPLWQIRSSCFPNPEAITRTPGPGDPDTVIQVREWQFFKEIIINSQLTMHLDARNCAKLETEYADKELKGVPQSELDSLSLRMRESLEFRLTEWEMLRDVFARMAFLEKNCPMVRDFRERQILEFGANATEHLLSGWQIYIDRCYPDRCFPTPN